MSDRYDAPIQLVVKVKNRNQPLDTAEILKPYFYFDAGEFKRFGSKPGTEWLYSGYRFESDDDEE